MSADFAPGSILVERYEYERPGGGKGIQWVVYMVGHDSEWWCYSAHDTRRAALELAAQLRGIPGRTVSETVEEPV